jgi:hypothetical protein
MEGPVNQNLRGGFFDQASPVKNPNTVGKVAHHLQVVGYKKQCQLKTPSQFNQKTQDLPLDGNVEGAHDLVADEGPRPGHQGTGQGDALPLTTRKFPRALEQVALAEPDLGEDTFSPFLNGTTARVFGLVTRPDRQKVPDGHARIERRRRVLKNVTYPGAVVPQGARVAVIKKKSFFFKGLDRSPVRGFKPHQQSGQTRFS